METLAHRIIPLHHVACDYPVAIPHGSSVRVVITEDGVSQVLLDWFVAPRNLRKSKTWQRGYAQAFGLFYDFVRQRQGFYRVDAQFLNILSDFAQALLCGTVQIDEDDPTELFWPQLSFDVADAHIKRLSMLSDFCVEQHGAPVINPWSTANWAERLARFRAWDRRNSKSLLKHLGDRRAAWARSGYGRTLTLQRAPCVDRLRPPFFPPDKFPELIKNGFKVRNGTEYGPPHARLHIRDMMIAILQGAGGLRESEPFHLYFDDVREDPRSPGSALVHVHHPSQGKYRFPDALGRGWLIQTREEFLRSRGFCPRHIVGQRRLFAGWKDPLLIREKSGDLYMEIQWFPTWWGLIFWDLYCTYIRYVRPNANNPFLFLSQHGDHAGEPYALKQYNKKLARAISQVGVEASKEAGGTSHGLRHMYGQNLTDAGIPQAVIQKAMHHKSDASTAIYTRPEANKINRLLNEAQAAQPHIILPNLLG